MPAPLAKGPGYRSTFPSHPRPPHDPRPNHPFTSGLIIAASVIVAAGIALYESPQVRQWVDQSRRKIAVALHNLGDEIQPRRPSESSDDFELRKKRREDLIRKNRNELIKRAREEGIAVDLDELARIGTENSEMAEKRSRADRSKSFDDMVGSDGMLKNEAKATGTDTTDSGLRKRGAAGVVLSSAATATVATALINDQVVFDQDDDEEEAQSPQPFYYAEPETRESSATVEAESAPLIDITSAPETQRNSEASETEQAAKSFYSFASSPPHSPIPLFDDADAEYVSTGTLTPRSERSLTTGASVVDSHADDIAILSMQNDSDHDARSDVFSEGGFTDAGFSEAGFSELGAGDHGDRLGIMTPSSWTDVGSDDESEWGGAAGHVSQMQQ